jgi:hypothetical protein
MEKFNEYDFQHSKFRDLLEAECDGCGEIYFREKRYFYNNRKFNNKNHTCSKKCMGNLYDNKIMVDCSECGKRFLKKISEIKRTINNFCSYSCNAKYSNKNKTIGVNRSKMEFWVEESLSILYPNLDIKYNDREKIDLELDIYIPSLNLAFELNGIFHYKPIFGESKLNKTIKNDCKKMEECGSKGIELHIIDISYQKRMKPSTSQKYLDIITKLVNMKLSKTDCVEVL